MGYHGWAELPDWDADPMCSRKITDSIQPDDWIFWGLHKSEPSEKRVINSIERTVVVGYTKTCPIPSRLTCWLSQRSYEQSGWV
jgi:hypothetical protein